MFMSEKVPKKIGKKYLLAEFVVSKANASPHTSWCYTKRQSSHLFFTFPNNARACKLGDEEMEEQDLPVVLMQTLPPHEVEDKRIIRA